MTGRQLRRVVVTWIKEDFRKNPVNVIMEAFGMALNVSAAMWIAFTAPTPPLEKIYVLFILASVLLFASALKRGSTFFSIMYAFFFVIDSIGFYNSITG